MGIEDNEPRRSWTEEAETGPVFQGRDLLGKAWINAFEAHLQDG